MDAKNNPHAESAARIDHATFTIERTLQATPAQAFAAWSTPQAKARWFSGTADEWTEDLREMDFRVGGREQVIGTWRSGMVSHFDARYHDIATDHHIVYSYDMYVDHQRISVSIATVELLARTSGTLMRFTEQVTVLDPRFPASGRETGSIALMDKLVASLQQTA